MGTGYDDDFPRWMGQGRFVLGMSQEELGKVLHASRKTVGRWESGGATPGEGQLMEFVTLVYDKDPNVAAEIARAARDTLEALGVVEPPSARPSTPSVAAPPEAPQPPPPPSPPRSLPPPLPPTPHPLLVEAVVCAAAEEAHVVPKEIRPIVLAAFRCALAAGLDVATVVAGLSPKA